MYMIIRMAIHACMHTHIYPYIFRYTYVIDMQKNLDFSCLRFAYFPLFRFLSFPTFTFFSTIPHFSAFFHPFQGSTGVVNRGGGGSGVVRSGPLTPISASSLFAKGRPGPPTREVGHFRLSLFSFHVPVKFFFPLSLWGTTWCFFRKLEVRR